MSCDILHHNAISITSTFIFIETSRNFQLKKFAKCKTSWQLGDEVGC